MWHKEAELVTHDIVESDGTYNLIVGGRGGTTHSQRTRAKIKENNPRYWKYNKRTPEQIEKHRIAVTGRKRSDEEKRSISEKMKGVAKPRACCIICRKESAWIAIKKHHKNCKINSGES